jgi:hypothetical protein
MPGMPGMGIARAAFLVCALSGCAGTQTFSGRSYLADNPQAYAGRVVGDGHCVRFVQAAAAAPRTSAWRAGAWVRGNNAIPPGTVIATFESDGTYTPETGNHAAVYLSQDRTGIRVYDQWNGQPVHQRVIRFEGGRGAGSGSKSNDGKLFRVVVVEGTGAEVAADP